MVSRNPSPTSGVALLALGFSLLTTGPDAVAATQITPLSPHSAATAPGFSRVDPEGAGIRFTNSVPADRHLTNQIYLNGSGIALGDVTGDRLPDLLFAAPAGQTALFRNLGGWRFQALPESLPSVARGLDGSGVLLADLDGDGDLDAVLNTVGQGTHVWWNQGQGTFAVGPVLNLGHAGTSLAAADADGDGDLDLYTANYRPTTLRDDPNGKFTIRPEATGHRVITYNGRPTSEPDLVGRFVVTPSGVKETGEPDALFLNEGQGRFRMVSWTEGVFLDEAGKPLVAPPYDWGLSVMFRDVTGDGRPDLYVCNDFESPDRFWINETVLGGPVRFRAAPLRALRHTSAFSMGVDAADVNRDGIDDFLVLDMLSRRHADRSRQADNLPPSRHDPTLPEERNQFSQNTLFLGRGDGTFAEIARFAGLAASEWSWTPLFLDVDLDGWEDVLISNGHELDMMDADIIQQSERVKAQKARPTQRELLELRRLFPRLATPNAAFRNGGKLAFTDVSKAWRFDNEAVTHGMAAGDLDGDGDLDIVQNNLNAPPTLLRNEAPAPRIAVRASALGANRDGIGARIRITGGPVPVQTQVLLAGGRYLSSDQPIRTFAAAPDSRHTVELQWPSGRHQIVSNVPPDTLVEVTESPEDPGSPPPVVPAKPWMEDLSSRLNHVATQSGFDDFARQRLLPWSGAYPSPGVTWADLDGQPPEELVIGAGAGGTPAVFSVEGSGFRRWTNGPLQRPLARDLTTLLPAGGTLLAGSSNYRDGRTNGGILRVYALDQDASGESLLGQATSVGPLVSADFDGDGALEIFVGGRAKAGRYPESVPSLLLKSDGGRFSVQQRLPELGLINAAVAADLNGDGWTDLVAVEEWGGIRFLQNQRGSLAPWDPSLTVGLELWDSGPRLGGRRTMPASTLTGWWTSVATGDFDGDGRLDLIVGNRGWNWFPVPKAPDLGSAGPADRRRLQFGDLTGQGQLDLLESYPDFPDTDRWLPVRRADILLGAFFGRSPRLQQAFPTRAAFGQATIADLLKAMEVNGPIATREAIWFSSAVFLNRGTHWLLHPLPREASMAPIWGLSVADFDGDGAQDLLMAQNFMPVRPDEVPQDAGCGLLLRGDGVGNFEPIDPRESGIRVWGDARGSAVGDFDQDGRPDVAIAQNSGPTVLFHNLRARPGLRVVLKGLEGNATGVGVQLRPRTAQGPGALQEVQSGSGWMSVDSPVRILTAKDPIVALEVRWPATVAKTIPVPSGAAEVEVDPSGTLKVVR